MAYVAVHERLILAAKALAVAVVVGNPALFPGLSATQVWDQIDENPDTVTTPAVLLTIEGVRLRYERIDQYCDHVIRPVIVGIVDRQDPKFLAARPPYLLWHESLVRAFREPALLSGVQDTVPEARRCDIDLDPMLPKSRAYEFFKSAFALNFLCLERRGLASQQGW